MHLAEVNNWLVGNGERACIQGLEDTLALLLQDAAFLVILVDLLCGQVCEQAHGFQIAIVETRVRFRAEATEHAVWRAVHKPDWNAHMRPNRNFARDRHGQGEGVFGGIRNKFG